MTVPNDVMLHNTLASFKKEMLLLVSETIENKLNKGKSAQNHSKSVSSAVSSKHTQNDWHTPLNVHSQGSSAFAINSQTKDETKLPGKEKHVLILDPHDCEQAKNDDEKKECFKTCKQCCEWN